MKNAFRRLFPLQALIALILSLIILGQHQGSVYAATTQLSSSQEAKVEDYQGLLKEAKWVKFDCENNLTSFTNAAGSEISNKSTDFYIKGIISPSQFKGFLDMIDLVCDSYCALLGVTKAPYENEFPFNGKQVRISITEENRNKNNKPWMETPGWFYSGNQQIFWREKDFIESINNFEKRGEFSDTIMHELAHYFDDTGMGDERWCFNKELFAYLKTCYAMETALHDTVVRIPSTNRSYKSTRYRTHFLYNKAKQWYDDDKTKFINMLHVTSSIGPETNPASTKVRENAIALFLYFSPIIDQAGWGIFEKTFSSYSSSISPTGKQYTGNNEMENRLFDFIDRLTFYYKQLDPEEHPEILLHADVLEYAIDGGQCLREAFKNKW